MWSDVRVLLCCRERGRWSWTEPEAETQQQQQQQQEKRWFTGWITTFCTHKKLLTLKLWAEMCSRARLHPPDSWAESRRVLSWHRVFFWHWTGFLHDEGEHCTHLDCRCFDIHTYIYNAVCIVHIWFSCLFSVEWFTTKSFSQTTDELKLFFLLQVYLGPILCCGDVVLMLLLCLGTKALVMIWKEHVLT